MWVWPTVSGILGSLFLVGLAVWLFQRREI